MIQNCKNLDELWDYVHEINKKYFSDNDLMPILGNGRTFKPTVMFVFINPTARNISSDKRWKGPRFPFIGTKQVWRIFHRAGLFDDFLIEKINKEDKWSVDFTNQVLEFLKNRGFYFTNIVKWTGHDATLPNAEKIRLFLPILKREIEIVQPEYIVTFGLIPFEKLTNKKIKLGDYYSDIIKNKMSEFSYQSVTGGKLRLLSTIEDMKILSTKNHLAVGIDGKSHPSMTGGSLELKYFEIQINSVKTKIIPCYFPIGRGHPKRAVEILRLVNHLNHL